MKSRRVGLFGGLFDPPHIAHLIIAQSVLEEFDLQTVFFIPAGNPPHKNTFTPYQTRFQMTEVAIKNNPRFSISDIEHRLSGKTYTIDVIRALQREQPGQMNLVIGSDQWDEFDTWKTPKKLMQLCTIIVVPRPGHTLKGLSRRRKKIRIAHTPLIELSSTTIRKKVARNESIQYLVPPEVLKFIQKRKLYHKTS
jgi:nicotinate-nucleotide adenylyltransferase